MKKVFCHTCNDLIQGECSLIICGRVTNAICGKCASNNRNTKNIQTSNYARKGADPLAIGISATVPKWYNGKRLDILAPTWQLVEDIIEGRLNQEEYDAAYIALLLKRGLTPQKVIDMLPEECYLLCYESPKDHCHRRLLADWIKSETGFDIPEWKNPAETEELKKQNLVDNLLDFE